MHYTTKATNLYCAIFWPAINRLETNNGTHKCIDPLTLVCCSNTYCHYVHKIMPHSGFSWKLVCRIKSVSFQPSYQAGFNKHWNLCLNHKKNIADFTRRIVFPPASKDSFILHWYAVMLYIFQSYMLTFSLEI